MRIEILNSSLCTGLWGLLWQGQRGQRLSSTSLGLDVTHGLIHLRVLTVHSPRREGGRGERGMEEDKEQREGHQNNLSQDPALIIIHLVTS